MNLYIVSANIYYTRDPEPQFVEAVIREIDGTQAEITFTNHLKDNMPYKLGVIKDVTVIRVPESSKVILVHSEYPVKYR